MRLLHLYVQCGLKTLVAMKVILYSFLYRLSKRYFTQGRTITGGDGGGGGCSVNLCVFVLPLEWSYDMKVV